jgi:hypothetical protein
MSDLVAIPPSGILKSNVTVPRIAQGVVNGTMIQQMNNKLSHACDFANDLKKNKNLQKYLIAAAEQIKKAIREVLRILGITDLSGVQSTIVSWLKGLAKEIIDFKKRILDPILEFTTEVLAFTTWALGMIAYIKSLPAKLLGLLESCLLKILSSIAHVMSDAFASVPGPGDEFKDVVSAVKEVSTAVTSTAKEVVVIAATVKVAQATITSIADQTGLAAKNSVNNQVTQTQGFASTANTSLSSTLTSSTPTTSDHISTIVNLTPATINQASAAVQMLTSSLPTSANVSSENSQSNSSKKSTP